MGVGEKRHAAEVTCYRKQTFVSRLYLSYPRRNPHQRCRYLLEPFGWKTPGRAGPRHLAHCLRSVRVPAIRY
jgi:hypothetical protein